MGSHRRIACRVGLLGFLLLQIACIKAIPITQDGQQSLVEEEGILILHSDSDVAFNLVLISKGQALPPTEFEAGQQLRALVVDAGMYRAASLARGNLIYSVGHEKDWNFRVEPGQINYPGQIVIRYAPGGLYIFHQSRTAMALKEIQRRFPTLLEQHPLVYTGSDEDEFARRYPLLLRTNRAEPADPADVEP